MNCLSCSPKNKKARKFKGVLYPKAQFIAFNLFPESPELLTQKLYAGKINKIFKELLFEAGFKDSEVSVQYLIACQNLVFNNEDILYCNSNLTEIANNKNVIIIGNTVERFLKKFYKNYLKVTDLETLYNLGGKKSMLFWKNVENLKGLKNG